MSIKMPLIVAVHIVLILMVCLPPILYPMML